MTEDQLMDALGDKINRRIFKKLVKGPQRVNEISKGLGISRQALCAHFNDLSGFKLIKGTGATRARKYELKAHFWNNYRFFLNMEGIK